jgi:hypothetical protein
MDGEKGSRRKPVSVAEAIEIFKEVWMGKTKKEACGDPTKLRNFTEFCVVHNIPHPKKGELRQQIQKEQKKEIKISKKALKNENLANKIRMGIFKNAEFDPSWAKTGISFLEAESKGQSGTVTPEEYAKFVVKLFEPQKYTCEHCGGVNDLAKKSKPKSKSSKKKSK